MKNVIILIGAFLFLISCSEREKQQAGVHEHGAMQHAVQEGVLHLNEQQVQLGHITVDSIGLRSLGEEFLVTGVVGVNETKVFSIAARVMGRIERLYFKNVGETISEGSLLYEIYSEELNGALRELFLAAEKNRSLRSAQVDLDGLLEAARSKLRLYGLTDKQIMELESGGVLPNTVKIFSQESGVITSVKVKEGDYVNAGSTLLEVADLSSVWVQGQVYSRYLGHVKEGMSARVTFPAYAGAVFTGTVKFMDPQLLDGSAINRIRIEIPNKDLELKPGSQAYLHILTTEVNSLALPTDAVLLDGRGATVWVQTGENMYASRMVTTGLVSNGYTEIKSGLKRGDRVVVTGAYLLNSEFIFMNGVDPMAGNDMSDM